VKKIRAVILDFDGVLVESNEVKDAAFEEFFSFYPDYRDELIAFHRANHAHPRREKFVYAAQRMGRADDRSFLSEMEERFSALVSGRVIACPSVPGASEFLEEFHREVRLYISSVTPQVELQVILRGRELDCYFTEVFGNPPTPKKEAISRVLEREQLEADEVAFVGDAMSDYQVATAAGLVFWGRESGCSFPGGEVEALDDLHAIGSVLRPRI
jgi:phosphoglycolate phosphatase-like HAD superfamily hydrolase